MKKNTILLILFSFASFLQAQKHDYNWIFGYGAGYQSDLYGVMKMDFNNNPPSINLYDTLVHDYFFIASSFSDSSGNLLFTTNGCYILDRNNMLMENGDSLNAGEIFEDYCPEGYLGRQSLLFLQNPDTPNIHYIYHKKLEYDFQYIIPVVTKYLLETKIDMAANDSLGKVIYKNRIVHSGTMTYGELNAVKHSNGKDWWILNPYDRSNKYHVSKFTKEGIVDTTSQLLGGVWTTDVAQGVITPDGTKYIRYNKKDDISIFDFNRTTGMLSNYQHIPLEEETLNGNAPVLSGCSVSPNSRFLYISAQYAIYQYDLWSSEIAASKELIAVYDGYQSPYATIFSTMHLAPDCKIYITCLSSVDVMHVIHEPDKKGLECNLVQHGIQLPYLYGTLPFYPNYRLGATTNSPCDSTLSIHTNQIPISLGVTVYPNPFSDWLQVQLPGPALKDVTLLLFDIQGRLLKTISIPKGQDFCRIETKDLQRGLYFWELREGHRNFGRGKVVKE